MSSVGQDLITILDKTDGKADPDETVLAIVGSFPVSVEPYPGPDVYILIYAKGI